jgi:hypothetical protein
MPTKKLAALLGAAAIAALLSACASDDGRHHHHAYVVGGIDYDGFYDDYYGPIQDGYWGTDNYFYYQDGPGHPYRRDEGGHVRHEAAGGFHAIHGHHSDPAPQGERR